MKYECSPPCLPESTRNQIKLDAAMTWHSFFAWFPVRVSDTKMVWWENVERRFPYAEIVWGYTVMCTDGGYVKHYSVQRNCAKYRIIRGHANA